MKEDGIDVSKHNSNNLEEYRDIRFDYVITLCDHNREVCLFFPSFSFQYLHLTLDGKAEIVIGVKFNKLKVGDAIIIPAMYPIYKATEDPKCLCRL
ncbi:MAG: hypothetical protein ABIO76_12070 [Ginsengibacter sp.]